MNSRIISILALIVAAGIFFAYVNPTWTGPIAATRAAIASDDQALTAAKQYLAQQDQLAAAHDAIDSNSLSLLSSFLPDSVDNVRLILDLNALAARSQLALSSIDVASNMTSTAQSNAAAAGALPAAGVSPVNSVDLSLTAVGTFSALQNFLVGVEKSARLLDVRDLTIKGSDTGVYEYQMKLRLYWLR